MAKVAHVVSGERLSKRNLWSFSTAGIGRDMAYGLWSTALLLCIMYTKGVSAKQLSVILVMMAVCRIWDAINDPIMGGIIERTRTKFGKFKPWIMIGAVTNALVTFTIFAIPLRGQSFVIFFPFAYLLWDITFTMNDISYWGMMPSLTSNDDDRNKITMLANLCAGIGGGIAGIAIPLFTTGDFAIGGNAVTGYAVMAGIICIIFALSQFLVCAGVKERRQVALGQDEKIGVKDMFKVIFKNDQLLWIAIVMIIYNLGSTLYYSSIANYILFRFGYAGANVALFSILGGMLGAISILYPWLAKRFTRRAIAKISMIVIAVGYISMFLIGAFLPNNFYLLVVGSAILVVGQSIFYTIQTISIANTVEYNEFKTGKRNEGIIFSIRPFMAKMGSALVVLVTAIIYGILGVANFTKGISDIENQASLMLANGMSGTLVEAFKSENISKLLNQVPDSVMVWMLFGLTIIPLAFVLLSYFLWRKKFVLTEDVYSDMVAKIEERKAQVSIEGQTEGNGEISE